MIRRIMAAVDFSEPSEQALEHALALGHGLDAAVDVLHVYELPLIATPDGGVLGGTATVERLRERAAQGLEALLERHAAAGVEVSSHLREGLPHGEIVRAARDLGVDLIVMGTHARSGIGRVVLGSVAERVVRTAPAPVVTVPHARAQGSPERAGEATTA